MTALILEPVSKIDLEPTDHEINMAAWYDYRFDQLRETIGDWRDFLCLVENQLRRDRGLIPA